MVSGKWWVVGCRRPRDPILVKKDFFCYTSTNTILLTTYENDFLEAHSEGERRS